MKRFTLPVIVVMIMLFSVCAPQVRADVIYDFAGYLADGETESYGTGVLTLTDDYIPGMYTTDESFFVRFEYENIDGLSFSATSLEDDVSLIMRLPATSGQEYVWFDFPSTNTYFHTDSLDGSWGAYWNSPWIVDTGDHHVWTLRTAPVPEPATLLLLGSGLAGLAAFRRKFKR